ncbi:70 kDa peptidyl-prolyl isomerase-like [Silene latifolia]|uniref:70 kDa peptidyl-prolyl isomerase-like n=1 Tax=Silene latifolia TaxID=37657 RepID=UPI003D7785A7
MENDGGRMLGSFMKLQESAPLILAEVRELKVKGNNLFRQNYFDSAAACYDEGCKLLSLSLGNIGGEDIQSLSDLAVSLISNMAACALKLEEYRAISDLCSMILDSFPRNVKARFRRAVASIKLKRFSKAELDLVEALAVEPSNKDVLRELDVVRGHLLIKENGKRVLEVATNDCVEGSNKKHIHVSASNMGIKDSEAGSRR